MQARNQWVALRGTTGWFVTFIEPDGTFRSYDGTLTRQRAREQAQEKNDLRRWVRETYQTPEVTR
jgi:hypothetical protein